MEQFRPAPLRCQFGGDEGEWWAMNGGRIGGETVVPIVRGASAGREETHGARSNRALSRSVALASDSAQKTFLKPCLKGRDRARRAGKRGLQVLDQLQGRSDGDAGRWWRQQTAQQFTNP